MAFLDQRIQPRRDPLAHSAGEILLRRDLRNEQRFFHQIGTGVVAIELREVEKKGRRLVEALEQDEVAHQVAEKARLAWPQPHRIAKAFERRLALALRKQCGSQVARGVGVRRIELARVPELRLHVVERSAVAQVHHAKVVMADGEHAHGNCHIVVGAQRSATGFAGLVKPPCTQQGAGFDEMRIHARDSTGRRKCKRPTRGELGVCLMGPWR